MVAYIITGIIILLALTNLILGIKLYEKPNEEGYFNNVGKVDLNRERNILAEPKHISFLSIITGILIGLYFALLSALEMHGGIFLLTVLLLFFMYLKEIKRKITLKDGKLILTHVFTEKELDATKIRGMYIYSYNKKFLKSHAYTTKLVITDNDNRITKYTLSSLDNKAVLNLMKESFGINSYKMYISKHERNTTAKKEN